MEYRGVNANPHLKIRAGRVLIPGFGAKLLTLVTHLYPHSFYVGYHLYHLHLSPCTVIQFSSTARLHESLNGCPIQDCPLRLDLAQDRPCAAGQFGCARGRALPRRGRRPRQRRLRRSHARRPPQPRRRTLADQGANSTEIYWCPI